MTPLVLVPALDPAAASLCLQSMELAVQRLALVVDNSEAGMASSTVPWRTHRPEPHGAARPLKPERNLGVAGSFNYGRDVVLSAGHSHLVWVSTSVRFTGGALDVLSACRAFPEGWTERSVGLHVWAVGRKALAEVGEMDMNLWPGYWEDCDYVRRLNLAGVYQPDVDIACTVTKDGAGYDVLLALNPHVTPINFDMLKEYYALKWGGPIEAEMYERPFNGPHLGLDYWPPVTRAKLIERHRLG